ncbi:MAG TPA: aminopeptidase P N-terminal domain-containing protein [Oligoflexia bacterium]|nr:aminopeptidase P N-terminal domain-containing protein [Oligoflexia bacterium]HMP48863.1 aminopeptidase P N-terminal domain-containing protein [Oligoflexia bacterium]
MSPGPRMQYENRFSQRRKKLLSQIKTEMAIFSAAPERLMSRDLSYPFVQNSDFFYLTGLEETPGILVLRNSNGPKSILYIKDRNPEEERWVGERIGIKRARRRFKVDDIRPFEQFEADFPTLIEGTRAIHYAPGTNELLDNLVWSFLSSPLSPRYGQPAILKDPRIITSEMRVTKDKDEVSSSRRAIDITARALRDIARQLPEVKSEKQCALLLESYFAKYGGSGTSFPTIVAAGKNATVLHHSPGFSPIWKQDLVLIDSGTKFKGYSGDITRVYPVSGKFSTAQADVYDAVHEAVEDALSKSMPGNCLDDIHIAAARSLTRSLIDLSVLSGNPSTLFAKGAYKKYFMHRTGHWLGLDVHDTSPATLRGEPTPSALHPLQSGMLYTVEPGLYFPADDNEIPKELRGIGIRLEEDILITAKGHEVLSAGMPIERKEVENLF